MSYSRSIALFASLLAGPGTVPGQVATPPQSVVLAIQERIQSGDMRSAGEQLSLALKRYPKDGGLHNLAGVVAIQEGRPADAEARFRQAMALSPRLEGAYLNLARLYEQSGNPAMSIPIYRQLLAFAPGRVEARLQLAYQLLLLQKAFVEAESHIAKLPEAERASPFALAIHWANLVGLRREAEARKTAAALLQAADFAEEDVLQVLPAVAGSMLARELLSAMLQHKRSGPATLAALGYEYEGAGELQTAQDLMEKAAREQAGEAGPLLDLARLTYKQRNLEGALGYLAHARDLEPKNGMVHFFFGMVCVELDLPREARESLQKAVKLAPDQPYYRYALGAVTLQGFDATEAIPHFEAYLKAKPDDASGRFALGVAYFQAGKQDDAKRELKVALARPETAAGAGYYLGRIARLEGDTAEAMRYLEPAVQRMPKLAGARAELGLAYLREGRVDDARREIEAAVALDPEGRAANQALLVLYQRSKDARTEAQRAKVAELERQREKTQLHLLRTLEIRR